MPGPGTGRWAPRQSACHSGNVGDPQEKWGPSVMKPNTQLAQALERRENGSGRGSRCRPGHGPAPRSWRRTGRACAEPGTSVPTFRLVGLLLQSWPPNLRVSVVYPRETTRGTPGSQPT